MGCREHAFLDVGILDGRIQRTGRWSMSAYFKAIWRARSESREGGGVGIASAWNAVGFAYPE
jgi:hypothetical protein